MHAQSLTNAPGGRSARTPGNSPSVPLRGRFGWVALDAWTVHDHHAGDIACAVLTAAGRPGDPAEQAMPALAAAFGLDSRPGAHTVLTSGVVSVTLSERAGQHWVTLHAGPHLILRRPVPPRWYDTAHHNELVRLVVGYRAQAADADGAEHRHHHDAALIGHGVTADVPVHHYPTHPTRAAGGAALAPVTDPSAPAAHRVMSTMDPKPDGVL